MGLRYPDDLTAWRAWADASHPLQGAKAAVRHRWAADSDGPRWTLTRGSEAATVLLVIESTSPTSILANLRPAGFLESAELAVLSPGPVLSHLPSGTWHERTITATDLAGALRGIRVVASSGHYLPIGAAIDGWAKQHHVPSFVVQHGLITPLAPPLPRGARLLAWSAQDADFWTSGRTDVTTSVVGSQLLHTVAHGPQAAADPDSPPLYLGQLHGAELPRRDLARAAYRFCREHGAVYRPHPSERDKASRLTHALWERRGITIDRSGTPLAQSRQPVVSAFSTGVLEAAARGLPAWVDFVDPPPWLTDFWRRYGMSRWGNAPTQSPQVGDLEPARLIAEQLAEAR